MPPIWLRRNVMTFKSLTHTVIPLQAKHNSMSAHLPIMRGNHLELICLCFSSLLSNNKNKNQIKSQKSWGAKSNHTVWRTLVYIKYIANAKLNSFAETFRIPQKYLQKDSWPFKKLWINWAWWALPNWPIYSAFGKY